MRDREEATRQAHNLEIVGSIPTPAIFNMKKEICENCKYWQDYFNRIFARIEGVSGNFGNGNLELRLCKYRPAPVNDDQFKQIYTDQNYSCSAFVIKTE